MPTQAIAVLGGGTMGAGIAQAALAAGLPVILYDVDAAALERARAAIAAGLGKQGCPNALERLRLCDGLAALADAALVIEAAPERLDLKRDLFAQVAAICPPPCVIASNTSSLPIARLAAGCLAPERIAGLHFFNPVHRTALVEVICTAQTDDVTVATLLEFAQRLGKTPVLARDTPGFIVNRVARPFYGEALRLLGEQVATPAQIDQLLQAAGFPIGPFALMDLIGIDINLAVTQSIYEQSFGEPRYRPHPIQQQKVLAGQLGRKSGRGFYAYDDSPPTTPTPATPPAQAVTGAVLIGAGSWAPRLEPRCRAAGLAVLAPDATQPQRPDLRAAFVVAGRAEQAAALVAQLDQLLPSELPILAQCADCTAAELASQLRHPQRLVGFDGLWLDRACTLVQTPVLAAPVRAAATVLLQQLGSTPNWVADSPALVVPRVVAALANEAAFALGEGVADAETIDTAMRLGTNHPIGPLARAAQIGFPIIVAILDHLRAEYGEERYRVAPLLRRAARLGVLAQH